jgi:hypothetical protein
MTLSTYLYTSITNVVVLARPRRVVEKSSEHDAIATVTIAGLNPAKWGPVLRPIEINQVLGERRSESEGEDDARQ